VTGVPVCENCAAEAEDDDLVAVWPAVGDFDAPELWCGDCRDRYPHEEAEAPEEVGEAGP
jgi:hypothetical protein